VLANAFSIFLNYLVILVVCTRAALPEFISSNNSRQKLMASTAVPASSNQASLAA